ncbi:SDR family oxidoreductase [Zavarzinella formosa]|uniref:SDR family oxidoreductase n=1 Tax=Zavarzinella formosa TaxID=360055 RepID=UPI0012FAF904|nr:SDR family oxidoreductase [Zavarzinella formosa]
MKRILHPTSNVLITGVTGLVGGEIFRHLLARGHQGMIWPLIRPGESDPICRLNHRLARSGDDRELPPNVRPVAGDILQDQWGLDVDDLIDVTAADIIIHNAADTSFDENSESATTNVESVRQLIDLARKFPKPPLIVYMSTASNVGDVTDANVAEDDGCRPDNHHHNGYTQSKAVSERLLQESGLPVLVLRPTIVLSPGIPDAKFARQILWCVPLMQVFRALPINPGSRLDVVDVGFVAEATLRLLEKKDRQFDCYHLSAGADDAVTLGRLNEVTCVCYDRSQLDLINPADWNRRHLQEALRGRVRRKIFKSLRYYFPFLNMNVVYDRSRLEKELGDDCPAVRPLVEYLPGMLELIGAKAALREAMMP